MTRKHAPTPALLHPAGGGGGIATALSLLRPRRGRAVAGAA